MGIAICDVDALVADAVRDRDRREAHVDEERNVAVAKIVYADLLHTGGLGPALHLVIQEPPREGEEPVVRLQIVEARGVIPHFLAEELGHFDRAVALFRFRRGDDVPALYTLIRFADTHGALFEIEIRERQRQQLAHADAAPVEHFERVVGQGLAHYGLGEFEVFLLLPEIHLARFLLAHAPRERGGVLGEPVMLHGVVQHGAELVVDGLEVGLGIGLSLFVAVADHHVLPLHDVPCGDVAELLVPEIGQELLLDEVLLREPCVLLELGAYVPLVKMQILLEGHVGIGAGFEQEPALPLQRLALEFEPALALLLVLAGPVGISGPDIPCSVFVFVDAHCLILCLCVAKASFPVIFDGFASAKSTPASFVLLFLVVESLVEVRPADTSCQRDVAFPSQLGVQLPDDLVTIGVRNIELLRDLLRVDEFIVVHSLTSLLLSDRRILCRSSGDPVRVLCHFLSNHSATLVGARIIERFCQYMVAAVVRHTICCKIVLKTGSETGTHGGARIEKIYFSKRRPIRSVSCCRTRLGRPIPDTGITKLLWGICLHPQPSLKLSHASYTIFAPKSATHGGCKNFGLKSQYIDAAMLPTAIC